MTLLRSCGRFSEGIHQAERWLSHDQQNEHAHRLLMSLHLEDGSLSAALTQYERCADNLRTVFQSEPSAETKEFYAKIREGTVTTTLRRPVYVTTGNLPNLTTKLIGRIEEIGAVERALDSSRAVTVTGAGGSGKTTLALEIGHKVLRNYTDGVWFANVATVDDPALVAARIAESLGLQIRFTQPSPETISGLVGRQQLLLILDNCEHVLAACAQLVDCLSKSCPNVSILATSREPLGLASETVYRLPCLSYPGSTSELSPVKLESFDAVRLFLDRARRVVPDFHISKENASLVANICEGVDGLPLALEMAGSLVEALEVKDISRRVRSDTVNFQAVHRGANVRHKDLTTLVDWSYRLLTKEERMLLRRLSVFRGGWTVEAAEAVCGEASACCDVVGTLVGLVNKSLVQPHESGRYRMLEPIRQFAQKRLLSEDTPHDVEARHCAWCLVFARDTSEGLYTNRQNESFASLDSDYSNICKAIEFAISAGDHTTIFSFGGSLYWYWFIRERVHEGLGYLTNAIRSIIMPRNSIEARGLAAAGYLCWWIDRQDTGAAYAQSAMKWADSEGDDDLQAFVNMAAAMAESPAKTPGVLARIERYWENSLRLYRSLDNAWGVVQGLLSTAVLQIHSNRPTELRDYDMATRRLLEATEVAGSIDDQIDIGKANYWMATIDATCDHDMAKASTRLRENLDVNRNRRAPVDVALSMAALGQIELEGENPYASLGFLRDSLDLLRKCDSDGNTVFVLHVMAYALHLFGDTARAIRLMSFVRSSRRKRHSHSKHCDRWLSLRKQDTEEAVFEENVCAGKKMTLADAIELAEST